MSEDLSNKASLEHVPSRPLGLEVAMNMMRETKGGADCTLWTPLCWDIANYIRELEAYAERFSGRSEKT